MISSLNLKGRQLNALLENNLLFVMPKFVCFAANSFEKNYLSILKSLSATFDSQLLIIRSSAADEDANTSSLAGQYDSILNIPSDNPEKITEAIKTVIASYEKKRPLLFDDEVIVQEMVQDINMSGVIFTHDLNTGAPYFVINYDDQSGLTDSVTSGNGENSNRTLFVHRNSINKLHSDRFIKLIQAVKELEQVMDSQFLDIEFALGKDMTPYLFQVRLITTQPNWNIFDRKEIDETLQSLDSIVKDRLKRFDGVYGETSILGQMADWNPVEMIGRAPRALSLSLYQALITDNVWSSAREIMGYHIPKGQPLLVALAGQPFIDTRLSFHSYLPNTISSEVGEKIVTHWVDNLRHSPELHDKVEFDIAITAYSFDIDSRIKYLIGDSLSTIEKKEFKKAHLEQTRRLIKGSDKASLGNALNKIEILITKQFKNISTEQAVNISSLSAMVSDCIQYGTIPFAILARHGFIARTILLSLKSIGVISKAEMSKFEESVKTVSSNFVDDIKALNLGELDSDKFMALYGHLRPGTYDIMSQRYDQMDGITKSPVFSTSKQKVKVFKFSKQQQIIINDLLMDNGFDDYKADDLLNYMKEAIIGREYGKFVFTRSISNMLELIANFSEKNGLSRYEISHVPINSILKISKINDNNIENSLRYVSEIEEKKHQISIAIRLPQLLTDQAGVYVVPFQVSHPNFITHKKVIAKSLIVCSEINKASLKGKIVLIEVADPGFDWIFSQEISGLITKYGGANSHMAIRCAEFGIPAAIGCGEHRFESFLKSNEIELDCATGLINVLH